MSEALPGSGPLSGVNELLLETSALAYQDVIKIDPFRYGDIPGVGLPLEWRTRDNVSAALKLEANYDDTKIDKPDPSDEDDFLHFDFTASVEFRDVLTDWPIEAKRFSKEIDETRKVVKKNNIIDRCFELEVNFSHDGIHWISTRDYRLINPTEGEIVDGVSVPVDSFLMVNGNVDDVFSLEGEDAAFRNLFGDVGSRIPEVRMIRRLRQVQDIMTCIRESRISLVTYLMPDGIEQF